MRIWNTKEPGFSAVANVTPGVVCIASAKTMEKNCIFWSCLVPWMELFNAMIDSVIDWANKKWNLLRWFDWNHVFMSQIRWMDNSPIPRLPSQAYLTFVSSCLVEDIVEHQAYIPNVHQRVANTSQIDDKKKVFQLMGRYWLYNTHLSPFCNSSNDTLYSIHLSLSHVLFSKIHFLCRTAPFLLHLPPGNSTALLLFVPPAAF